MKIISVEPKNVYRAKTTHLTGMNEINAHKKIDDVFYAIVDFLSHGQREVSYTDLAEVSSRSINTVKYCVSKLVACNAVKIS